MSEIVEKIIFYCLGGIVGIVVGFILLSIDMPFMNNGPATVVLIITALIGVLVSIAIYEYNQERILKQNTKIRNETVALITHEMRTGLTSTGWAIELMLKNYGDKISEMDKKMLQDVVSSIHTTVMHSINLLDVSLLDIGKLAIAREWVSLKTVEETFRELLIKYNYGAERKGIKLNIEITLDHLRQVEVDMLRMRIIMENLLENALQYTVGEGKEINVVINNDKNSLNIKVSDSGIGIPGSEQSKVFSEFYRASNARKTLSSGSGIGLYMCYEYVKAHNGTIRLESKENVGSTFYVTIPIKTVANVNEFLTKI